MMAPRQTPRVLVVDDDPITNRILCGMLARAGFQSTAAFGAAQALEGMVAQRPDLVLMDVHLPDGNGFDICRTLQSRSGLVPTPVLFISADNDIATKVRGFDAGGVDFITKPLAAAEILARVSTHLRLRQAHERLAELQASQIRSLAGAQEAVMPAPELFPEARFAVSIDQLLLAGGDFYDVIPVGNRVFDYIVADASGHDLGASFWTAALKALLGEYATPAAHPRDILVSINGALCRMLPEGTFFTLIYARLNRQTGNLSIVNAGHPPAVVVRQAKPEPSVALAESDVIGAFPDASFASEEFRLLAGDRFYLYSDGLIEPFGPRAEALRHLSQSCTATRKDALSDSVQSVRKSFSTHPEFSDDVLILGVEA
jgi:sigma-B regulation protein RsbU (phosphoserine phosphatase)